MDIKTPLLLLRLEGPLQSWGERAQWNNRDTSTMPTKSAIIGMISCTMGLKRGDSRICELNNAIKMAVRADRPGLLMTDFHTVTGEIKTAEGKLRQRVGEEGTLVTYRQYLQDASFLVAISAAKEVLCEIRDALCSPKWTVYLGRKSCVPSSPVIIEMSEKYTSLEDVMNRYPFGERSADDVLYETEAGISGYPRRDVLKPVPGRLYEERRVILKSVHRRNE